MCNVFLNEKGMIFMDLLEAIQTNSDHYIMMLTKLKKTIIHLQHKNGRTLNSLKTMNNTANFCWAVLTHPLYSLGSVPDSSGQANE